MNTTQRNILGVLKKHFVYTAVLAISLLFFLYKGLTYLIIGSYVPFVLISVVVMLFILSSRKSEKSFKKVITTWGVLIIIWSFVRLLLSIVNHFVKPIPESHISNQLGIYSFILSILFLSGAIYLLKYKRKLFNK